MESATCSTHWEKVVIQFGSKSVRGYLEMPEWNTIEDVLEAPASSVPEYLRIRLLDSEIVEDVPITDVKAVFYVNSFDGDPAHATINFHTRTPIVNGVWVRLEFLDGEVMEGLVQNSIRYLVDPGFFLLPTDPASNNKLVYVLKKWIVDHRVLGLRNM
jgi:hypothetical protein